MSTVGVLFYVSLCIAVCGASSTEEPTEIRALFGAYRIPDDVFSPYDSARLKILYPREIETEEDFLLPVVIFLQGTGVEANRYQWLAERLVRDTNVIVVLPSVMVSFPNGFQVHFPGTGGNLTEPDPVLVGLFSELERMNSEGSLAGKMDLNKVILGGHSAGGFLSLINANRDFFPGLVGVFSYGSNLVPEENIGYPPAAILRIGSSVPALHLGGNRDRLVGTPGILPPEFDSVLEFLTPLLVGSLDQNLDPSVPACFIEFVGFNHFSVVDPLDMTSNLLELDGEVTVGVEIMKDQIGLYVSLFVKEHGHGDINAGTDLRNAIQGGNPYVGYFECTAY